MITKCKGEEGRERGLSKEGEKEKEEGKRREREREGKGTNRGGRESGGRRDEEQSLGDTGENWSTTHSANWQLKGKISAFILQFLYSSLSG